MTENEELLKKLFAEKDFKPNDAQYRAITHIEGPLFLTADLVLERLEYCFGAL